MSPGTKRVSEPQQLSFGKSHFGEVGGDFEGHDADEIQEPLAVLILAVFLDIFLDEIEFAFHYVIKAFAAHVVDVVASIYLSNRSSLRPSLVKGPIRGTAAVKCGVLECFCRHSSFSHDSQNINTCGDVVLWNRP